MYRFTYFESQNFTGPKASNYVEEGTQMPIARSMPRGEAYGFEDFVYAEFQQEDRYVFGDISGPRFPGESFTVAAYIRFRSLEGEQMILDSVDVEPGRALRVGVDDGFLFAEVDFDSGASATTLAFESDDAIEANVWYRLVLTARSEGSEGSQIELWIDEERVLNERVTLNRSQPQIGEPGRLVVGGNLQADVFAVEVGPSVTSEFFLQLPLIRDGSAYFGMPAYFGEMAPSQYLNTLDHRIRQTYFGWSDESQYPELDARLKNWWIFPFHNDAFVIQGIAGDPDNGRIFLGMYHRTSDNVSYGYPSIVVELFVPEGRMGNVFVLQTQEGAPLFSHMGGIAYWDDLIFVPGPSRGSAMNPDLYVFDLAEVEPSAFEPRTLEGFEPRPLPALHRYTDPLGVLGPDGRFNSLSYMDIHVDMEDRILLNIGNFQADVPRPVHSFHLVFTDRRHPYLLQPRTVIQANRRSQGGVYYMDVETTQGVQARRMLLSTSYADNDSVIYDSLYLEPNAEPRTNREWMRLPAGLEDMTLMGNSLWTTSESAAIYFQRRASNPWEAVFPFLMEIDISDLIDSRGYGVADAWYTKHGLTPSVDPLSDQDGDGFSIRDEYLWDTDPHDSAVYPWSGAEVQPTHLSVETSLRRFYTLQELDLETGSWNDVAGQVQRRGNGGQMDFPLPADEGNAARFYRVVVATDPTPH